MSETVAPRSRIIVKGIAAGLVYALTWALLIRYTLTVEYLPVLLELSVVAIAAAAACWILTHRGLDKWGWSFALAFILSDALCIFLMIYPGTEILLFGSHTPNKSTGHICDFFLLGKILTMLILIRLHHDFDSQVLVDASFDITLGMVCKGLVVGSIFIFFWWCGSTFLTDFLWGSSWSRLYRSLFFLLCAAAGIAVLSRGPRKGWVYSLLIASGIGFSGCSLSVLYSGLSSIGISSYSGHVDSLEKDLLADIWFVAVYVLSPMLIITAVIFIYMLIIGFIKKISEKRPQ